MTAYRHIDHTQKVAMRKFPIAILGASLIAVGLALPSAQGSTPPSSALVVPTAAGGVATVNYNGTIPTGSDPTNDCSTLGGVFADKHTVTITAPPGGYKTVKAVFVFSIDWTTPSEPVADEILTLLAPDGSVITSSDGSAPLEAITINNLPSGKYTMLACGFVNVAPQAYHGRVRVRTASAAPSTNPGDNNFTVNDKTATFTPATVVDPILFGGEPGITFDPTTNGSRSFIDWPVSSRTNIGVFLRSTDGALSYQKRYADVTDVGGSLGPLCLGRQVPYCPTGGGGDTDVDIDPGNGNIYFSSQESLANEASGTSFDHGTTFPADHSDPVTHKSGGDVDRQWLAHWNGTNTVFLAFHSPIVGAYITRSDSAGATGTWTIPPGPQVPFVTQTGAFEADNTGGLHNHTLYLAYLNSLPDPNQILDQSFYVAVSTDGAQTFQTHKIPGGDNADSFTKIYIDTAGNLYAVWTDSTTNATYLATSKANRGSNIANPGSLWKGPYQISASPAEITIFPDVRAGSPGRIAAIYYGTGAPAATPDDVKPGQGGWYPYVAMSTNALCMWDLKPCKSPTFHQTVVTSKVNHDDNICTSGTACAATMGNRNMADYWDIDVDRDGHLGFVWDDTTNGIGGPFVKVARQMSGPSLYAGNPNASQVDRGNGFPDAAGDARFPFSGAKILTAPNHPTLDLRGTSVVLKGSNLEFTVKLASTQGLSTSVPTGNDGLTLLQQAKYVIRWDFGTAAYYVGANVAPGGAPSFFSGTVSPAEGINSLTNPDNLNGFGNTYAPLGPATGTVSGNNLIIDVPVSAVGSPKQGSQFYSVGSYTMVGPRDQLVTLTTLPITVDASPTFNTRLATTSAGGGGGNNGGGGSNGGGTRGGGSGSLATTGGTAAPMIAGLLLLLTAAFMHGRRRRTPSG
jgi:hypothetical protein